MKDSTNLINFLNGSDTFNGITMNGCYDMPLIHLAKAYDHFIKTGENVLDQYSELKYLHWKVLDYNPYMRDYIDNNKIAYFKNIFNGNSFWNVNELFSKQSINEIIHYLDSQKKSNDFEAEYPIRRRVSIRRNKTLMDSLSDDAKICSYCGAINDLTIDHIIPIKKGGSLDFTNCQVLCRSCNSKKRCK